MYKVKVLLEWNVLLESIQQIVTHDQHMYLNFIFFHFLRIIKEKKHEHKSPQFIIAKIGQKKT